MNPDAMKQAGNTAFMYRAHDVTKVGNHWLSCLIDSSNSPQP
jgi:hypothetical protein